MHVRLLFAMLVIPGSAQAAADVFDIETSAGAVAEKVIAWRHDLHANPELGNREFRTAGIVAEHLRSLSFDSVQTGVAHTGVVGVLRGGKAGPVVALRADMDALPVTEQTGLPYASTVTAQWRGQETGVMHACGHDAHTAILMGVAEVLANMREEIPGSVKFIFQPAEEGAPPGEEGGAELMVAEGVLGGDFAPGAIFGLHVAPFRAGSIGYRAGGMQAASDGLEVVIKGRQTHGAMPWAGVDPVVVAAQVVSGIQNIVSRQIDITKAPAIVTFGSINGGNRGNIIPSQVKLTGTIRAFDPAMRNDIHERIRRIATMTAESHGATAEVTIDRGYPVTRNDPELTESMKPVLDRYALGGKAQVIPPITASEDFSYYANEIPGLFFALGVAPEGRGLGTAAPNHSPYFVVNDAVMHVGVKALAGVALEWLVQNAPAASRTVPAGAASNVRGNLSGAKTR
ncbi:MAG: amidohydrolase [Pseudomonadota bacterium]